MLALILAICCDQHPNRGAFGIVTDSITKRLQHRHHLVASDQAGVNQKQRPLEQKPLCQHEFVSSLFVSVLPESITDMVVLMMGIVKKGDASDDGTIELAISVCRA